MLLYWEICEKSLLSTIKIQSHWLTCTKLRLTPNGNVEQRPPNRWQPSTKTATPKPRTTKTRLLLSRTGETPDTRTDRRIRTRGHLSAVDVLTPVPKVTQTRMANTDSTAKSRITPRMSAGIESRKINHAETNKDLPTGQKCMWPAMATVNIMNEINRVFLKSLMTHIIQAPSIISQLILSLCTISIATCNKLFEIMTPFNGDKIRPRFAIRAGSNRDTRF